MSYAITRKTDLTYSDCVEKVTEALKDEGFGVLTTIDVKKTLKEKIDADYRDYVILGACNPELAYKTLQAEPDIGVLLPCNVVVYDGGEGETVISAMDPSGVMQMVENPKVAEIADEVRTRLERAVNKVAS